MSEESAKDVSPLRLKRPSGVPGATPPPATPAPESPPEVSPAPSAEPAWPTPPPPSAAMIPPAPPAAPSVPAGDMMIGGLPSETPAPAPVRKRPTLMADKIAHNEPKPAAEPAPEPPAPIKLRMGSKQPPPSAAKPGDGLPDDLFPAETGAPLVPLPGLPSPGATSPGRPAFPPLPPLPPLPPSGGGARPPGTVPIPTVGASGVAPLMPMPLTGGTRPPMPVTPPALPTVEKVKAPRAHRDLLIFLLIFVLLGAVGGGAYFYLTRSGGDPAETLAGVKETLGRVAELPGKAVDGAKESIAGARAGEQDRVDSVLEGKETPDRTGVGSVTPAELEARLKAQQPQAKPANSGADEAYSGVGGSAGGVKTEPATEAGAKPVAPPPVASARLVRYAEGLNVSGVFQGTPARALVNGRLIREGDVVDPSLGIRFVGVDAETKHLVLEEASGAQVRVKY